MRVLSFAILILFTFSVNSQNDTSLVLNKGWTFSLKDKQKFYPARVPGNIYSDLFANELIKDPFIGNNEKELQWVTDSVWCYRNLLFLEDKFLLNKHVDIVFEGLDTYAKVWINDSILFNSDNAFRIWKKDVKKYLKPGKNEIRIEFYPVTYFARQDSAKLSYTLPEGLRIFVRKPQFQFGWDFAPKFLGCGIWKNVKLNFWNDFECVNVQMIQTNLVEKLASYTADIEINSSVTHDVNILITDKN